jgi:hypothetical protein
MQLQVSNYPQVLETNISGIERVGKRLFKQSGAYHGAERK